jgi:hypothetical protein
MSGKNFVVNPRHFSYLAHMHRFKWVSNWFAFQLKLLKRN